MIKKLINRLFWWATDDIYDEGYDDGIEVGYALANYRFIKLWEQEMLCDCEDPMNHLLASIKGEQK